jgi:signal transduction histidine kinase
MKPTRLWPIRWWLGVLIAGVALPLLLLLGSIFALQVRNETAEARENSLRLARAAAARLVSLHRDSRLLLERMAERQPVRSFDSDGCDSLFAVVEFFPQFADILLIDADGALRCSAPASPGDPLFIEAAKGWAAEELRRGRLAAELPRIHAIGDSWVVALAAPVASPQGVPAATLVVLAVAEVFPREAVVEATTVTILDRDGTILVRSSESERWAGKSARESGVGQIVLAGLEGTAEATGIDGVSRQYGFTPVEELGWTVHVGVPTALVMRPVRDIVAGGVVGGLLIVAIVVIIAAMLSRGIEAPVEELVRAAAAVSRGEFDRVETDSGPREIAELAEAFNAMVASRREAEQLTRESERKLKALSDRLIIVQEQERTRIARELHDDLGQSLTALKMDVTGLLARSGHEGAGSPLEERILATLDLTVTAVQRISSELRPSVLDDLGLVAAIEWEARLFEERTGIECELSLPDGPIDIGTIRATAVYRIIQEAFTNVARHSNAARVEVRLRERGGELLLEIRDDGRGIRDDELRDPSSLGLLGIRERAGIIGATVEFEGVSGRGTIVQLRIPTDGSLRTWQ